MQINLTQPYDNTTKIALNFTSSQAGRYRFKFYIDQDLLGYLEKSSAFYYNLTFRHFTVIFNWSDLLSIPNLVFRHGVQDGKFWFILRHDNVPENYNLILDPTLIVDQDEIIGTRYEGQHKTFRNPRGMNQFYALFYFENSSSSTYDLRFYNSSDGSTWTYKTTIHDYGQASKYESADLWIHDDGSKLLIYLAYSDVDGNLYYKNCTLSDSGTLTQGTEQTVFNATSSDKAFYPQISLDVNEYLHITYEREGAGTITNIGLTGTDADPPTFDEWEHNGSLPWISGIDQDMLFDDDNGDYEGWFTFEDTEVSGMVYIDFYCKGDGDDELDFYLSGLATSGTVVPDTSWGWKDYQLGTYSESVIDDAELRVMYDATGKSNYIYIDMVRLKIVPPYSVAIKSSEVTLQPTVSNWSDETILFTSNRTEEIQPKHVPLNGTRDLLVIFHHQFFNDYGDAEHGLGGIEVDWNGSDHSTFYEDLFVSLGSGTTPEHPCIVADETTGKAWVLYHITGQVNAYVKNWIIGSGFTSALSGSLPYHPSTYALSVDLTSSPNVIYVFTRKQAGVSPYTEFYVRKRDSNSLSSSSWIPVTEVNDTGADTSLTFFSSSYSNSANNLCLVYCSGDMIRFYNQAITYRFTVTYYFYEGGSIAVNGTSKSNGTSIIYDENDIANITGNPDFQYKFKNHTYDTSHSLNNPFYLTVNATYTLETYFRFDYDCNKISLNSTLAGQKTLFQSDWEDLHDAEGLSHWLASWNNSGSWVNSSWSDTWYLSTWAQYSATLSSTVGLTVSIRFYANDSNGYEYKSTILILNTSECEDCPDCPDEGGSGELITEPKGFLELASIRFVKPLKDLWLYRKINIEGIFLTVLIIIFTLASLSFISRLLSKPKPRYNARIRRC